MIRDIIKKTALFHGMNDEEISEALETLGYYEKDFKKGEFILNAGDTTEYMGLVLSGSVLIENSDIWGSRTVLSHVGAGDFFAETYAILKDEIVLVDVEANENCRILFIRTGTLISEMKSGCRWVLPFTGNLLRISTRKNLMLSGRSFHIAPKTARGRIMSYLTALSYKQRSRELDIPFDRQQLADYLNLDRTALSRELSHMQKDGLIEFKKNHFKIISDPED